MEELWDTMFRDNQELWGMQPSDSTISTLELFKKCGLKKILIPGFGYGRNASVFLNNGFDVTGIEISETAIEISKKHIKIPLTVHHGSVTGMPFDKKSYDGVFCYALIHLLNPAERIKFIRDCYNQLEPNGLMVFIAISNSDPRYGKGKKVDKDTFETNYGIRLFFYDTQSIEHEFGNYGLIEAQEINDQAITFWNIICRKDIP